MTIIKIHWKIHVRINWCLLIGITWDVCVLDPMSRSGLWRSGGIFPHILGLMFRPFDSIGKGPLYPLDRKVYERFGHRCLVALTRNWTTVSSTEMLTEIQHAGEFSDVVRDCCAIEQCCTEHVVTAQASRRQGYIPGPACWTGSFSLSQRHISFHHQLVAALSDTARTCSAVHWYATKFHWTGTLCQMTAQNILFVVWQILRAQLAFDGKFGPDFCINR
jgi:hypothetical protein